jgi:hypothetical protein
LRGKGKAERIAAEAAIAAVDEKDLARRGEHAGQLRGRLEWR